MTGMCGVAEQQRLKVCSAVGLLSPGHPLAQLPQNKLS